MDMTNSLLTKVLNKVRRVLSKHISYNSQFKPRGVKSVSANHGSTAEFILIRPPYVSKLRCSQQFLKDCSPFKPVMRLAVPGDFIIALKDGRIYSCDAANTAVISSENYLIDEVSFQWKSESEKLLTGQDNAVFHLKGLKKPTKYKGTVFSLLGGGAARSYYYHWMIDAIAKLGLLKESGRFDEVDYFLVPAYNTRYHKEYLDHFGITEDKIIVDPLEFHIQADCLMATSFVQIEFHHPKWAVDFLYNSFVNKKNRRKQNKLIYIPRGDSAVNRKVLNERELIDALRAYGFEIHYLADMSVQDEAILLNSARMVVGMQGSGFANLVFCEPGTKVLEIFPETYVRHIDYDICNKRGLEFHYLICPSDSVATDTLEGQKINVIADVSRIVATIDLLLKSETSLDQSGAVAYNESEIDLSNQPISDPDRGLEKKLVKRFTSVKDENKSQGR